MTPRQNTGFVFEAAVIAALGADAEPFGALFDAKMKGFPMSIKSRSSRGELCLGDYRRQASVAGDFLLVVGQVDSGRCARVDAYVVAAGAWRQLLAYAGADVMYSELKEISCSRRDDEKWTAFRCRHADAFDAEHAGAPLRCRLAMKRDHKGQKRIQAAVARSHVPDLAEAFPMWRDLNAALGAINALMESGSLIVAASPAAVATPAAALAAAPAAAPAAVSDRALDKFYTSDAVVDAVVDVARAALGACTAVVEPSAGGGAFLARLKAAAPHASIHAYDIAPEAPDIVALDFLQAGARVAADTRGRRVCVVGNPPYGRNCALAVAFLNACARHDHVDTVVFVLPLSFGKASVQRRVTGLTLATHLPLADLVVGKPHFTLSGAPHAVPSCVQVWVRAAGPQPAAALAAQPVGWRRLRRADVIAGGYVGFDLEIVRVGGRAGCAFVAADAPKRQYNYFIVLDAPAAAAAVAAEAMRRRGEVAAAVATTTGAKSLSVAELTPFLNACVLAAV